MSCANFIRAEKPQPHAKRPRWWVPHTQSGGFVENLGNRDLATPFNLGYLDLPDISASGDVDRGPPLDRGGPIVSRIMSDDDDDDDDRDHGAAIAANVGLAAAAGAAFLAHGAATRPHRGLLEEHIDAPTMGSPEP